MNLTIAPTQLESLTKAACSGRPKKKDNLTLTAINNRLSVECNGVVAVSDATVRVQGAVTLHAKSFRKVLDTFKGTPLLEIEASVDGLRIQNFRMGVVSYNPQPRLAAD
jgi:DNA polymerase III sliding clamp (beta) subunit (PCNA family)